MLNVCNAVSISGTFNFRLPLSILNFFFAFIENHENSIMKFFFYYLSKQEYKEYSPVHCPTMMTSAPEILKNVKRVHSFYTVYFKRNLPDIQNNYSIDPQQSLYGSGPRSIILCLRPLVWCASKYRAQRSQLFK